MNKYCNNILSLILALAMAMSLLCTNVWAAAPAVAEDSTISTLAETKFYTSGNFVYKVENGGAVIVGINCNYTGKTMSFPSTLGKYPVTEIRCCDADYIDYLSDPNLPNSVTQYDCWGCYDVSYITIPASVKKLDIGMLGWSVSITVDEDNTAYASKDGVLFNKKMTQLLQMPVGRTKAYTIPSTVTTIGPKAFESSGLPSITIPGTVKTIGEKAFAYCQAKEIVIEQGVTTIDDAAFLDCPNLKKITIPSSVTKIGGCAIGYCDTGDFYEEVYGITVYGVKGSAAEKYVQNNKQLTFKTITQAPVVTKPTAPAKPTLKSASNVKGKKMKVTISKKVSGANGYEIQYAQNKKFTGAKTASITKSTTLTKTITKLTKKKTYYVRVRSYKTVSGEKVRSGWSAVKSVKITK